MSREIKFRAWDEADGFHRDKACMSYGIMPNCDADVIMQFTNIKDKNDKDIYEGDVLKFHYFYGSVGANLGFVEAEHSLIGVVEWGAFGWGLNAIKGEHWRGYTGYEDGEGNSSFMDLCAMNESGLHEESFEVIGNIYETPELLYQVQDINNKPK